MSQILGTNVMAPVVPFSTADVHATHDARYGRGGYRCVADNAERDGIAMLRREAGMIVYVQQTGAAWRLATDLATWLPMTAISDPQLLDGGNY